MKRIIIHWTGGPNKATGLDKQHYHYIIEGDGTVVKGNFPVEANEKPVKGAYAAHTLNCNTGSIGVSLASMAGAQERPFVKGSSPITDQQLTALVTLVRTLMAKYNILNTRETILTHAEVQPTLGIQQRGKWDITWLPGMHTPQDPVEVGDMLRDMIAWKKQVEVKKVEPVDLPVEIPKASKSKIPTVVGGGLFAGLVIFWKDLKEWFLELINFF